MPRYSWQCPNGSRFVEWAPFGYDGEHEPECPCCGLPSMRDLYADLRSQLPLTDDPIRKAYLGTQIDRNLQEQGRALDPMTPHDKFDAKWHEKNTGRIYIGDDISQLRPNAQKAILNGERRRGQSRPMVG